MTFTLRLFIITACDIDGNSGIYQWLEGVIWRDMDLGAPTRFEQYVQY
jgi:hypothetical protein